MSLRSIAGAGPAATRPGSYEFSAAHVSARSVGRDIDPVLGFDHFTIRAPAFAPHPHAGFSAVTLLFEDGEGDFLNRDSLGHEIVVKPGAAIWTVAGSGVMHEEYPLDRGERSHGLQIFVNLAASAGAHVVLIAGRPLREQVVSYGPFVMNDEAQIAAAVERYRAGRMGRLESKNES